MYKGTQAVTISENENGDTEIPPKTKRMWCDSIKEYMQKDKKIKQNKIKQQSNNKDKIYNAIQMRQC